MEHASLALATLAFVGTHLALSHPLRVRLVQTVGDQLFLGLYSVVAAVTLLWMILAYRSIDYSHVYWSAPEWGWWLGSAVMLLASLLLVGSFFRNPAFPHPGAKGKPKPIGPATGVFAITRHPMNWSFILWALVHIGIWGSLRNLIPAGGILILALVGSLGQDHKKLNVIGQTWRDWMERTSFVPFAALLGGKARWKAAVPVWPVLAGGFLFWLAVTFVHAPEASPVAALLR
ncbi:MAG TPA: NnrU family protein [Allosphingosinicella sp.]|jgi:uncharacterized membrane protein